MSVAQAWFARSMDKSLSRYGYILCPFPGSARSPPWIQGSQVHQTHQALDTLAVDLVSPILELVRTSAGLHVERPHSGESRRSVASGARSVSADRLGRWRVRARAPQRRTARTAASWPTHALSVNLRPDAQAQINGPTNLDSAVSEIFLGFQAANSGAAWPKYTASGVRRSSALCRRLAL